MRTNRPYAAHKTLEHTFVVVESKEYRINRTSYARAGGARENGSMPRMLTGMACEGNRKAERL